MSRVILWTHVFHINTVYAEGIRTNVCGPDERRKEFKVERGGGINIGHWRRLGWWTSSHCPHFLTWGSEPQYCRKAPKQLISLVRSSSGVSMNILECWGERHVNDFWTPLMIYRSKYPSSLSLYLLTLQTPPRWPLSSVLKENNKKHMNHFLHCVYSCSTDSLRSRDPLCTG